MFNTFGVRHWVACLPGCCAVAGLLVTLLGVSPANAQQAVPSTAPAKVRIVLAGDSTVTDESGWGLGFAAYLKPELAECVNTAKGGRSSKSFRDEGHWQKALDAKGTYVLIQFGHNDQPGKGPERETDPQTTYRANMERYVDEVRAAGGKPVLVTSIARRRFDESGKKVRGDLDAYADVVRAVAKDKGVPLIDLYAMSIDTYESLGRDGCLEFSPVGKDGKVDNTHFNLVGSEMFGRRVAWAMTIVVPESRPLFSLGFPAANFPATRPVQVTTATPGEPTTTAVHPTTAAHDAMAEPKEPPTRQGAKTITVAQDGSGDFRTVQAALAAVPDNNADRTTIRVKPGVYTGPFVVAKSKRNVSLVGENADTTILTYALNVRDPVPAGVPFKMGGNGFIVLGDDFRAENVTFRNNSGDHGQAMALRTQADRGVYRNCRLLGWQDTLLTHSGRQYFVDCYIEGRVDFIYGASTAVFERCEIRSKLGGYVTAASTPQENPVGYLFLDCKLTHDGSNTPTYLGRPWRPFAMVAFVRCELGSHIRPEGWHNWGKPDNEKTARYYEWGNTGPGADRSKRVGWSKELTADEAAKLTARNVLAGSDGWDPTRP
jgi:pectinesterase